MPEKEKVYPGSQKRIKESCGKNSNRFIMYINMKCIQNKERITSLSRERMQLQCWLNKGKVPHFTQQKKIERFLQLSEIWGKTKKSVFLVLKGLFIEPNQNNFHFIGAAFCLFNMMCSKFFKNTSTITWSDNTRFIHKKLCGSTKFWKWGRITA